MLTPLLSRRGWVRVSRRIWCANVANWLPQRKSERRNANNRHRDLIQIQQRGRKCTGRERGYDWRCCCLALSFRAAAQSDGLAEPGVLKVGLIPAERTSEHQNRRGPDGGLCHLPAYSLCRKRETSPQVCPPEERVLRQSSSAGHGSLRDLFKANTNCEALILLSSAP
jgi:hypothetical protein